MRLVAFALVAFTLVGSAYAEEPVDGGSPPALTAPPTPPPPPPAPRARLVGRVWERGTITPIPGAMLTLSTGEEVVTDETGAFAIDVAPGEVKVAVSANGFDVLKVTEKLEAGRGVNVDYRLTPKANRRRYESTVRGEARHEGERFTLRDEELHQAPGSLGDPFRVIGLLPGVSTPLTLLPYYVIRGASPGTSGFFIDGMRVPQLFHFLAGGGVVHGRLVDRLDFYPGAYDASFGRYAGGIVDSETRPARKDGQHGDFELRLYDVSALIELKLPKGVTVAVAGHYGYPSFIIQAIDPRVSLQYGDYQLRIDWRGLTVEALGSYDSVNLDPSIFGAGGQVRNIVDNLRLTFHRLQIRDRERYGRWDFEAALVGGFDEMSTFGGAGVRKLSLGWRFMARAKWKAFRLQLGTDGELSRFTPQSFASDSDLAMSPDQWGDLANGRDGVVAGAYVVGNVDLIPNRLNVTASARIDVYHAGPVTLLGVDPRLQFRAKLLPQLELHGGIGYHQQPPSFPVALPGIDTYALQLGLQHAIQSAVGVEAKLPLGFTLSLTGYYQQFDNVNDVLLDFGPVVCSSPPPENLSGVPAIVTRQVKGSSAGMELLLRRTGGPVSGWIAYTLSRSDRVYSCGLRPSDFDQRHILNVVVQARLPWKLLLGVRLYVATGRPVTIIENVFDPTTTPRNNARLPDFVQLDLRLDREWLFKKWAIAAFLEVLNLTYSQSVFGVRYPEVDGIRRYDMPQLNGFNWILPSIGVRARF